MMSNMKIYLALYSATVARDYHFIAMPNSAAVPEEALSVFRNRMKALLSGEKYIDVPKWLLDREIINGNPYVLWGVACRNSVLSEQYSKDTDSRDIQCFVGFIITGASAPESLPYDVECFKEKFESVMFGQWTSRNYEPLSEVFDLSDIHANRNILSSVSAGRLNYSDSVCRIFPSTTSSEALFAEALSSGLPVSLASGIFSVSEVTEQKSMSGRTDPKFDPFANAVLLTGHGDVKDVIVRRKCRKCHNLSDSLNDGLCKDCYEKERRAQEHDDHTGETHKDGVTPNLHDTVIKKNDRANRRPIVIVVFVIVVLILLCVGKCDRFRPQNSPDNKNFVAPSDSDSTVVVSDTTNGDIANPDSLNITKPMTSQEDTMIVSCGSTNKYDPVLPN